MKQRLTDEVIFPLQQWLAAYRSIKVGMRLWETGALEQAARAAAQKQQHKSRSEGNEGLGMLRDWHWHVRADELARGAHKHACARTFPQVSNKKVEETRLDLDTKRRDTAAMQGG